MYDLLTQQNKKVSQNGINWIVFDNFMITSLSYSTLVLHVYNYWGKKLLKFQFL